MFDMQKIGTKIAEARRNKDMTQTELADRLGISFQAVSNWERGNSMPDIAKLPEIAELLELSLDGLLDCSKPLAESIRAGNVGEYLSGEAASITEAVDAVPLMKPSEIQSVSRELSKKADLREIQELLPFLGQDVCDELFPNAVSGGKMAGLEEIAPFVSDTVLTSGVKTLYAECGIGKLDDLLPFVNKDTLGEIAAAEYAKNGMRHFECIAPFLMHETLVNFAKQAIEEKGIRAISPIAPFLGREFLRNYVKELYL
jgi:transcriptional regulator with XRE-family HTH domain